MRGLAGRSLWEIKLSRPAHAGPRIAITLLGRTGLAVVEAGLRAQRADCTQPAVVLTRTVARRVRWEEDARKAIAEGRAAPPRQGVKNALLSEWFNKLDEGVKADVAEKVEQRHKGAMKAWLQRKSEEPESPEDAVE